VSGGKLKLKWLKAGYEGNKGGNSLGNRRIKFGVLPLKPLSIKLVILK
jgi:hypothetical protein